MPDETTQTAEPVDNDQEQAQPHAVDVQAEVENQSQGSSGGEGIDVKVENPEQFPAGEIEVEAKIEHSPQGEADNAERADNADEPSNAVEDEPFDAAQGKEGDEDEAEEEEKEGGEEEENEDKNKENDDEEDDDKKKSEDEGEENKGEEKDGKKEKKEGKDEGGEKGKPFDAAQGKEKKDETAKGEEPEESKSDFAGGGKESGDENDAESSDSLDATRDKAVESTEGDEPSKAAPSANLGTSQGKEGDGDGKEEGGEGEDGEENEEEQDDAQVKEMVEEIAAEIDHELKLLADDVKVEYEAAKKGGFLKVVTLVLGGFVDAVGFVCMIFPPLTLIYSVLNAILLAATSFSFSMQSAKITQLAIKMSPERAERRVRKLLTSMSKRFMDNTLWRTIKVVPIINGIFPAWVITAWKDWVATKGLKEKLETVRADVESFKKWWQENRGKSSISSPLNAVRGDREWLRSIDDRYMSIS